MNALLLDIDEPQRVFTRGPDRTFPKFGAQRANTFGLRTHRHPASTQYSWPVQRLASSEARNNTSEATWAGSTRCLRHCASTISASPSGEYHFICRGVRTLP